MWSAYTWRWTSLGSWTRRLWLADRCGVREKGRLPGDPEQRGEGLAGDPSN
jgi:hypothetical protein